jgi:hypothetical protein
MRPQGFTHIGTDIDDLGWNDMGQLPGVNDYGQFSEAPAEHVPSSIAALTPAPRAPAEEPAVLEQQRKLESSFAEAKSPVVALPKREPQPRPVDVPGKKAAFTLRLDMDRHLKLRLACAVMGQSAQLIVTGALDDFLESLPELDALAQRVPAKAGTRG